MARGQNNKLFLVHLGVLVVLIGVFSWRWHQGWTKLRHEFVMRKINQALPPSFAFLINTVEKGDAFEVSDLEPYSRYAQTLMRYVPNAFDAYALKGFCDYHQGQTAQAIEAFQKALEIKPDFLLGAYDLGVMYWNQGDRLKAQLYFEKFLQQDFVMFQKQIVSSKMVYAVILYEVPKPDWVLFTRWKQMSAICRKILSDPNLSLEKLKVKLF
jgi:tetratricopeptide (TPR) repeat protein